MKQLLYSFLFLLNIFAIAQNQSVFEEGNTLYNQGKYAEAIDKYRAILNQGKHSAELYFNIANAHYKLNHIAPSIFYYEEALRLSPNDKDIKNNLAFAQNMTIDAIDNVPQVGISKLLKSIVMRFSFDCWALWSVLLSIGFVLLFVLYYFAISPQRKRLAFISSGICLVAMLITLLFAFKNQSMVNASKPAIVFAKETKVKNEPNFSSEDAFTLHEGTKVNVLDNVDHWKKIRLTNGKEGWIISKDIKMLRSL